MKVSRSAQVAVDVDSTWCAWTTASGSVQVLNLMNEGFEEVIDAGWGDAVHAGAGTGRFLIQEGRSLHVWSPETGSEEKGTVDPGALLLEYPRDDGTAIAAATKTSLELFEGAKTLFSQPLQAPPLLLAWQRRRRNVLCLLTDGTTHKVDPRTGRITTFRIASDKELFVSCYDEVLGGIWSVSTDSPDVACFDRLETDPPTRIYRKELNVVPETIRTSHSGEWLIIRSSDTRPTLLFNVNSDRGFDAPGELASRGVPGVFSYDNRLVSVEGDVFETLPVPARADVRSRDGHLPTDAFWTAPPRMHRAALSKRKSVAAEKSR
ncbi:hypothetical protein [Nocardiopsis alkaliphila]|uniref:hypothetical protein n=1 Tax=Nocardiopsis alkaliphila TaxID=225762 RepID=UPI000346E063|nr:hypothetical protein [Nocardiopsis alkaliphila]